MAKTLNEMADDLKEFILNCQSDSHNKGSIRKERFNNLKLEMDIAKNSKPHVVVSLALSAAEFDLKSGEKTNGGLGPEERYVLKWLAKSGVLPGLNDTWNQIKRERRR